MSFGLLLLVAVLYVMARWNSSGPVSLAVSFSRYAGTNSSKPVLKLKNTGSKPLILRNGTLKQYAWWNADEWVTNHYGFRPLCLDGLNPILAPGVEIEAETSVRPFSETRCRFEVSYRSSVLVDRLPNWLRRFCSADAIRFGEILLNES